jgi:hypothetical protein
MVSACEQAQSCVVEVITRMIEISNELSGGWRKSGHKIWVQVSILSIKPALAGGDGKVHLCASAAFRQLADDKL